MVLRSALSNLFIVQIPLFELQVDQPEPEHSVAKIVGEVRGTAEKQSHMGAMWVFQRLRQSGLKRLPDI